MLSIIYEDCKEFEKSLNYLKKFNQYKEKRFATEIIQKVEIRKIIYETDIAMEEMKIAQSKNHELESQVKLKVAEIIKTQDATIQTIACLTESRDPETGNHIKRTMLYAKVLVRK